MAPGTGVRKEALLAASEAEDTSADEHGFVHSHLQAWPQQPLQTLLATHCFEACSSDNCQLPLRDAHLRSGWAARSRAVGITVTTIVVTSVISAAVWSTGSNRFLRSHTIMDTSSELWEGGAFLDHQDPCHQYTNLQLVTTEYSNLGHTGPDLTRPEGVSWRVEPDVQSKASVGHKELLVHASATEGYKPFSSALNRMHGKFASINLRGGSAVNLTFTVQDTKSREPVVLPTFSLTFFDLGVDPINNAQMQRVTLNNFWKFFLDEVTEVDVSKHNDGSTTFAAHTYLGSNHAIVDPKLVGTQRSQYAFSVVYRQASEVHCHLRAGPGDKPRLFTFAFSPSVLCPVKTADIRPPLGDLDWKPPLEVPVTAGPGEIFLRWLVQKGDTVRKGDEICSVKSLGGSVETHKAPCDGIVQEMQVSLQAFDQLDARLSEKTLAVIGRFKMNALELPHAGAHVAVAQQRTFFVRYAVKLHDLIRAGTVVAITRDDVGRPVEVRSPVGGLVLKLQQWIAEGDPVELAPDRTLAVIGYLLPLEVQGGETPVVAPHGVSFARWHLKKGDLVEKGKTVCFVRNAQGVEVPLLARRDGMLRAMQHNLPRGLAVDAVVQDRILATIGPLPPLEVQLGDTPVRVPRGNDWVFDSWKVKVGSQVMKGEAVALVRSSNGSQRAVLAGKGGRVSAMQEHLLKGFNIGEIVQDRNIAVISKFAALVASHGQFAIEVASDAIFKRWHVPLGAFVKNGSIIAEVSKMSRRGTMDHSMMISSPGSGILVERQPLVSGEGILAQQHGRTIALVSPPYTQGTVHNRMLVGACCGLAGTVGLLFLWSRRRKKACNCDDKQKKKKMTLLRGSASPVSDRSGDPKTQRLRSSLTCVPSARSLTTGGRYTVKNPRATVPKLATFDHEKPEAVRLDFAQGSELHTVYAQHKPLGIIHDCSEPVIVAGFFCNSYASTLGVQQGWRLVRVRGQQIMVGSQCEDLLESHLTELPLWPLRLAFKHRQQGIGSATVVCTFTEQPLGFLLTSREPKVSKVFVGSPAYAAGVKEGWNLVGIGEQLVPSDRNAKETANMLREAVALLPSTGKNFGSTPWRPWGSPSRF